jgi:hypothetical protein
MPKHWLGIQFFALNGFCLIMATIYCVSAGMAEQAGPNIFLSMLATAAGGHLWSKNAE